MTGTDNKKDFFISYTKTDKHWAEWIAYQLEDIGYTTIIQAWDFDPGKNFILEMHNATVNCERTIAVLSPNYFKSLYTQPEWAAAFFKDPTSEKSILLPVRVEDCKPEGLLASIVYIDLCELSEADARNTLLKGVDIRNRSKNRVGFPGTANKPKFPGCLPFNNLPFCKNPYFTGRKEIIDDLRKSFEIGSYTTLTQTITGLGGIGKTQIALEYSLRYGYTYDLIWWVRSEDPITLMEDYYQFALSQGLIISDQLDQKIILEAIKSWMNQNENWLFIFDNAEEFESDEKDKGLNNYLPVINTGHILITSRNNDWSNVGKVIQVGIFNSIESEEFLLKRTEVNDKTKLNELLDELGCLPLALEQAGAYIINTGLSFSDYLKRFQHYKLDVMKKYKVKGYQYTVATTWQMSIDKIQNESSHQYLNLCAFFAPDSIPLSVFIEGNEFLPSPLFSTMQDEIEYDCMLSDLTKYSLVDINNKMLSIHRLLQEVIRNSLDINMWVKNSVDLVYGIFDFNYKKLYTWTKCSDILAHALSIAQYADKYKIEQLKTSWLFNNSAEYLHLVVANYNEAETLYKRALEISENVNGLNHPDTATFLNNLALLNQDQSKFKEAEHLFKQSLKIREEIFGMDYYTIAYSLSNLGLLYKIQGKYNEAEPLFNQALNILEKTPEINAAETATVLDNLGGLYYIKGKYKESESLYKQSLKIRETILEENHPDIATVLNNLALLYSDQGKYDDAEALYKRSLDIKENTVGKNHPDTATAIDNLAKLYYSKGNYEAAEILLNRALIIKETLLEENHPDIATSLNNLALLYMTCCSYDKAKLLYIRALKISEKTLGANHRDTAVSLNNLARLYFCIHKYDKSESLNKKSLKIREKELGLDHIDTATSLNNLAELYTHQKRYEEAEPLYKRALEIRENVLGENNPNTAASLNNLATLYYYKHKYNEAEPLFKRALIISENVLGFNHPDTMDSLNNLATLYEVQGRKSEASHLRKRALEKSNDSLET